MRKERRLGRKERGNKGREETKTEGTGLIRGGEGKGRGRGRGAEQPRERYERTLEAGRGGRPRRRKDPKEGATV